MSGLLDFVFGTAERFLIVGVFTYMAVQTKHWAVVAAAVVLFVSLASHFYSLMTGFRFFNWRDHPSRWGKAGLFALDSLIFLAIFLTMYSASIKVVETLAQGIGV